MAIIITKCPHVNSPCISTELQSSTKEKLSCEDCCHPFSWLLHDKKALLPKKYKTERFDCINGLVVPCNLLSKKLAFCRLIYIPTFRKFVSCFKEPYTPVNLWTKVFAQF